MERGAKANVVACAWGAEFVKFLAALEIEKMLPPPNRPLPLLLSPSSSTKNNAAIN